MVATSSGPFPDLALLRWSSMHLWSLQKTVGVSYLACPTQEAFRDPRSTLANVAGPSLTPDSSCFIPAKLWGGGRRSHRYIHRQVIC